MTAIALLDVLQDFGARTKPSAGIATPPDLKATAPPAESVEDIVRTEVAKAEAALEERLALAHAAEIEALRQENAAETDAMLRRVGETAGEAMALRLGELEERLGHQAATAAARILGSFLSDELQKRSMESLARLIRDAVAGRETFRIEIRGPQSLLEGLQSALGEQVAGFGFIEAPGFDLSVTIDGNLLETRLAEWSAVLTEILQ